MEDLENRDDPQNTKGANAQTDDNDRANRITGAAQDRGQDLDQRPGKVKGDEVQNHLPCGGDNGRVLRQQVQEGVCREQDKSAEPNGDAEVKEETLFHTELDPVFFLCAQILADKAGDRSTQSIAHRPKDAVDFRGHSPGGDDDRAERVDTDLHDHIGDAIHGVLQTGRDPEPKHVGEIDAPELHLPETQPVGLAGPHQLPREQEHIDHLSDNRSDGNSRDAPAE